ncbi:uncharacterized protein L3040_008762 [Drepanopeziza brunnea f. sp. 'multigermtubi']|uniref:Uncharacterized protein n=1 Tax=Marssonina brunnea f. sp. multigermtubi (strain MB_m1) TaxID=1072389 RepID=K1X153_MARBU|nr:uncharacterized protein MBM_02974 [Drepanopeziza brunnea f. sp. 'multigermtubi' MB_m1]EKD18732.1 hypothetical protein MBM_02974 [Drepanopeziza brunnea f. sp. 'multigermtubi' MB_m1]KAJ5033650.1 hypothetical protein L3040_008762 [Drepanopeziza brunnea f. sp. 'multigermtubi']
MGQAWSDREAAKGLPPEKSFSTFARRFIGVPDTDGMEWFERKRCTAEEPTKTTGPGHGDGGGGGSGGGGDDEMGTKGPPGPEIETNAPATPKMSAPLADPTTPRRDFNKYRRLAQPAAPSSSSPSTPEKFSPLQDPFTSTPKKAAPLGDPFTPRSDFHKRRQLAQPAPPASPSDRANKQATEAAYQRNEAPTQTSRRPIRPSIFSLPPPIFSIPEPTARPKSAAPSPPAHTARGGGPKARGL